jgi:hypothetical integral membrane protein (TIGR02206 family)
MVQDLRLFGFMHWLIILSAPLTGYALAGITIRWPRSASLIRFCMGTILILAGLPWYIYRYTVLGWHWQYGLPLELCDVTLWLAALALFTLRPWIFELAYYWGIAGASMAILTPSLHAPLLSVATIAYFVSHCGIVSGTLYLIWSRALRPRPGSPWRAFMGLNLFGIPIAIFDAVFRTNYFFLRAPPQSRSLLDYLGGWPWYIPAADGLALGLFALLWLAVRKRAAR